MKKLTPEEIKKFSDYDEIKSFCKKCKKGFITNQILLKDEPERRDGWHVIITYKIFYDFCSNVNCEWSERRSFIDRDEKGNQKIFYDKPIEPPLTI